MGIQSKIKKGQVAGGSGVKAGGMSLPTGRMPAMPNIGPKHGCELFSKPRSGVGGSKK